MLVKKNKIGVIYGGMSSEHDISVISGKAIIDNLNKDKYEIIPIYIEKDGIWYSNDAKIDNIISFLKTLDIVFPVLHGKYGEDGSIQGLFEMFNIKYVGCNILSSSLAIDKVYTKLMLDRANIKNTKYLFIKKSNDKYILVDEDFNEYEDNIDNIIDKIVSKLKFPLSFHKVLTLILLMLGIHYKYLTLIHLFRLSVYLLLLLALDF